MAVFQRMRLLLIGTLLLCFSRQGICATVQDIRLGTQSGSTIRVVIDLTEKVAFKIFPLQNPDRVVIDLPSTVFSVKQKDLPKKDYLNEVRLGSNENKAARVVLEFNRGVVIRRSFMLAPQSGFQWRLVVDLDLMAKTDGLKQVTAEWYDNSVGEEKKQQQPAQTAPKEKPLIVLDPGHGGKDPGAIGVSGVYEKHLTLAMVKQLRALLEKTGRYRVKLTREKDVFISLYARRRFARSANADLFISIHADSINKPKTRGLSVYTLSEKASDKEAEKLAESENKVDLIAGIDLSGETQEVTDILIDLARRETNNHSSFFAEKLMDEIRTEIRVLPNSHRFAGFAVLKSPDVPSVLMEMGYLSNKEEERLLRQPAYREKLAKATVRAIDSYFAEKHKANFN